MTQITLHGSHTAQSPSHGGSKPVGVGYLRLLSCSVKDCGCGCCCKLLSTSGRFPVHLGRRPGEGRPRRMHSVLPRDLLFPVLHCREGAHGCRREVRHQGRPAHEPYLYLIYTCCCTCCSQIQVLNQVHTIPRLAQFTAQIIWLAFQMFLPGPTWPTIPNPTPQPPRAPTVTLFVSCSLQCAPRLWSRNLTHLRLLQRGAVARWRAGDRGNGALGRFLRQLRVDRRCPGPTKQ